MILFDTHCHLDVDAFDLDRSEVLRSARDQGVSDILIPAIQRKHWDTVWALCEDDERLHPALGLHPVFLEHHAADDVLALEEQLSTRRPVAIGEIGLDYFVKTLDRGQQLDLFERQLAVARSADLPVVLHTRKAHEDVLRLVKKMGVRGGFAHAFNGSFEQAQRYLDLGFKLGFGGMLTFERSTKLRDLVRRLPLEALVLETDAPDMVVSQHRGERNSPEYIPLILQALAQCRDEDEGAIAAQTYGNACQALGLL